MNIYTGNAGPSPAMINFNFNTALGPADQVDFLVTSPNLPPGEISDFMPGNFYIDWVIPEPVTMLVLALGLMPVLLRRRRKA